MTEDGRKKRACFQNVVAFSLGVVASLSCGGRQSHSGAQDPGPTQQGGAAGASVGASGAAATGATEPNGGSTGSDLGGGAGAAGAPELTCDAACLDSVATQVSDFGMQWQSSWFLAGCKDLLGHDCVVMDPCPNQAGPLADSGAVTLETFPVGGIAGRNYKVTFTFNAFVTAKVYQGGRRDQGAETPSNIENTPIDGFYRGGSPTLSSWGVWKLTVFDEGGNEARHYYMNSLPAGFEGHLLYLLSYSKSIVVVGGGKVTHRIQHPNCHAVPTCLFPDDACLERRLPNEPNVQVPPRYQDPQTGKITPTTELSKFNPTLDQPWYSNLGHLTVTNVEQTDDPVTQDYP